MTSRKCLCSLIPSWKNTMILTYLVFWCLKKQCFCTFHAFSLHFFEIEARLTNVETHGEIQVEAHGTRWSTSRVLFNSSQAVPLRICKSYSRLRNIDNLRVVSEKYPTCVYIFAPGRSSGLCGVWAWPVVPHELPECRSYRPGALGRAQRVFMSNMLFPFIAFVYSRKWQKEKINEFASSFALVSARVVRRRLKWYRRPLWTKVWA